MHGQCGPSHAQWTVAVCDGAIASCASVADVMDFLLDIVCIEIH